MDVKGLSTGAVTVFLHVIRPKRCSRPDVLALQRRCAAPHPRLRRALQRHTPENWPWPLASCAFGFDTAVPHGRSCVNQRGLSRSFPLVAFRQGKLRWHLAPALRPSISRRFQETRVASPSTHRLGHRRPLQQRAQHIGASRPTVLRRHRRECGWRACRHNGRKGAMPVDLSRPHHLSRNAPVPRHCERVKSGPASALVM